LLIVADECGLLRDLLFGDVAVGCQLTIALEVERVFGERLLRLPDRGDLTDRALIALRDVERALILRVNRVGFVAVRLCDVGLELRLQVGRVEDRQHLAAIHAVAFLHVDGVGRLGQRRLYGDVLIRRHDAGQRLGGKERRFVSDRGLDGRGRRRFRCGRVSAASGERKPGRSDDESTKNPQHGCTMVLARHPPSP
jgi:hypothetical protein